MSRHSPSPRIVISVITLFFLLFTLAFAAAVSGGALVGGRYISASGKNIVLSLSVGTPSPANLIVEQYISAGNTVQATSPRAVKIDNNRGQVKWLLRNSRSGTFQLAITLKNPLQGRIQAMVRYRDPRNGRFTELQITP